MSQFPSENSKQPQGSLPEVGPVDGLIDTVLDQFLAADSTSVQVPGYSVILDRSAKSLFTSSELDRVVQNASLEIQSIARAKVRPVERRKLSWLSAASLTVATVVAASMAISLVGWWSNSTSTGPDAVGVSKSQSFGKSASRTGTSQDARLEIAEDTHSQPSDGRSQQNPQDRRIAGSKTDAVGKLAPESPMKEPLVEPTNGPNDGLANATDLATSVGSVRSAEVSKLQLGGSVDREVISVIDSQFQQIWKQLGFLDSSVRATDFSVERIARLLLHRMPTSTELESIRRQRQSIDTKSEQSALERVAQGWLSSEEFNRIWADRLGSFYLGQREPTSRSYSAFKDWLESQVRLDTPVQEIQRQVLLGLLDSSHPAYFLREQWSQSSDSQRVREGDWVGLDQVQSRQLKGLSQGFVHITGNTAIACTQCHSKDSKSIPTWLADRLPSIADVPGAEPLFFNSIAALMVQSSQGDRKELFAKLDDDRVSKIAARLPDGRRIGTDRTPQQAIDIWVEQGSHEQVALLRSLWRDFFGEEIESEFGLDSGVAVQDRTDLIEYLSKQAVAQKAGVRQIVYWMLMSEPARQPEERLSNGQYMALDVQKLKDYAIRRGVFRSLVIERPSVSESLAEPLSVFAGRLFPQQPHWLDSSLLAQPSNQSLPEVKTVSPVGANGSQSSETSWSDTLLRAELRYRVAGQQIEHWARLLSGSDLTDEQIVEHAYLMSKHRFPTAEELKIWSDSSWSKSQRISAVLRLLAGIESSKP